MLRLLQPSEPPQTIILDPVHTAVWKTLGLGAFVVLVAVQVPSCADVVCETSDNATTTLLEISRLLVSIAASRAYSESEVVSA